ncbi:hypothetical protein FB446DRAFT_741216 [Lentinula raphanica]|nr:hypothetical protein FB446DRAFT_741216 [Lentinula raphanica]
MQPLLSLPDELLHTVIEYIAYIPVLPGDSNFIPKSQFTRPSTELISLSVASWRLRQVCLSYLFANIRIRDNDVEKLDSYIGLFSRLTKTLVIDLSALGYQTKSEIITRILPQLEQLLHIELRHCRPGTLVLSSALAHPIVTSVLVHELPDESLHNGDLSKVIFGREAPVSSEFSPDFERCLNHGMRLARLRLPEPETLDANFWLRILPGLEGIEFSLHSIPVSFSWLSNISSTHPTLTKIWIYCDHNSPTPTFISSFCEEAQRQDLKRGFHVKRLVLQRAIPSRSSQEWHITALNLSSTSATTSLVRMLMLVAASFPKLEVLTLQMALHEEVYDIGDLASVLAFFSSLRALFLYNSYGRFSLKFRNDGGTAFPPVETLDGLNCDETISPAASEILQFASLLARQVRNIDLFYFEDDMGNVHEEGSSNFGPGKRRCLRGLLPVRDSNRDVDATFQLMRYPLLRPVQFCARKASDRDMYPYRNMPV